MDRTKRLRKFVVVGAAAVLAGAVAVPMAHSQTTGDQVITASINSILSLVAGADVDLGILDPLNAPGNNDGTGTFDVTSNVPYTVSVESSSATMTDGGTETLTSPLAIDATASLEGVGSATNSTAANAAGGTLLGSNPSPVGAGIGDGTDNYSVNYLQPSSYAEAPGAYSVTLTFTAAEVL